MGGGGGTAASEALLSTADPRRPPGGAAGALLGNLGRLTHPVPHGPDRLDVIGVPFAVAELRPQAAHVEVHRAFIPAEVVTPDVVEELGPCPCPPGMAEQEGEQVELPGLEAQDPLTAASDHALQVHPEIQVSHEPTRRLPARPSEDAANPGDDLAQVIGLEDVVIGAGVEPVDAGLGVPSPADDDQGDRAPSGPELAAEFDSVSVREGGLEHDGVEVPLEGLAGAFEVDGGLGLVPFLPEGVHEFSAFSGVLLHHQDADVGRYHFKSAPSRSLREFVASQGYELPFRG